MVTVPDAVRNRAFAADAERWLDDLPLLVAGLEWGAVERVSTGLLGTKIHLQPIARQMLAAADRCAREAHRSP